MIQKFYSGETLSAAKLNGMVDEINSIKRQIDEQRIVDFEGGDLDVSPNGTTLSVRAMRPSVAGESYTPPFKITPAMNEDGDLVGIYVARGEVHVSRANVRFFNPTKRQKETKPTSQSTPKTKWE